jgi:molecular chaperone GrpE
VKLPIPRIVEIFLLLSYKKAALAFPGVGLLRARLSPTDTRPILTDMTEETTFTPDASHEAAPHDIAEPDDLTTAEARIEALEAEAADYRDKWMRAQADMENLRTRTRRDVDEARLYAVQKFAADVAETAENLRRGIETLPPPAPDESPLLAKMRDGFAGVERSFVAMLERNGVKAEEPVGSAFDANRHQAMSEQETTDAPPGTIIQAWSRTWMLNGRLLKPAMVVVAKAPVSQPLDIEA